MPNPCANIPCTRDGAVTIKVDKKKFRVCYPCYDQAMKDAKWEFLTPKQDPAPEATKG